LAKTALGAETSVPWIYHHNGARAALLLRELGLHLWALEGGPTSCSLFETTIVPSDRPVVLVVGNEISGVDPAILRECERIVHIPMEGIKRSLNAAVAFGIAAYYLRHLCTVETPRSIEVESPRI